MQFGQLHHVEYYVQDLVRSNAFYSRFLPQLNYRVFQTWDQGISWAHPNGTYLVFVQVAPQHMSQHNNRQGPGLNHIAFQGGSEDQLREVEKLLVETKTTILIRRPGYLCFEDLNGFALEIYSRTGQEDPR